MLYVEGSYTDELAGQIAKEQDTKLEILEHPVAYTGSESIDYPVMYGGRPCGGNLKTC